MNENEEAQAAAKWQRWPEVFPVCAKHKEELFADYGLAIASDEKPCVLCHPRDNDSLGG